MEEMFSMAPSLFVSPFESFEYSDSECFNKIENRSEESYIEIEYVSDGDNIDLLITKAVE